MKTSGVPAGLAAQACLVMACLAAAVAVITIACLVLQTL